MQASDQINKYFGGIEEKWTITGKRVIELEKDYKEHEMILQGEIEKVDEEKECLVAQVKKLEE